MRILNAPKTAGIRKDVSEAPAEDMGNAYDMFITPSCRLARGLIFLLDRGETGLNKNQLAKVEIVDGIREQWKTAQSVVLIDYRGLTVEEDTELRRQFRAAGVEYKVLKNTMITRAVEGMELSGIEGHLKGPTAVAFGMTDAVAPAKIATEFIKKTKKMTVKCGVVDGQMINAAGVQALADLPPREVLIAKMLGSMNAPITGLVGVLGATVRSLLYAINAVKEQKENAA